MKTKTTIAAPDGGLRNAMKQSINYVWMALGSLLVVHALPAQVTYQYTGNAFSSVATGGGAYTTTPHHVTATLVLNAALPKNQTFHTLPPGQLVSLTMNDGENTLTQTAASPNKGLLVVLSLSTDKDGKISAWDICESLSNGPLVQTTNDGVAKYDAGAKDRSIHAKVEGYVRNRPGNWVVQ